MSDSKDRARLPRRTTSDLPIVPGPVLALGACTVAIVSLAALFGWHPVAMSATVGIAAGLVVAVAAGRVRREPRQRQAVNRALENAEARVAGIVDSAMDAIVTVDQEQRIVLYNAAAEKVFGWPRSAVLGQPLDLLLPAQSRAAHGGHIRRFGETGVTSRRMGDQTIVSGLRANGEEFPLEASISQHSEDGKRLFTAILRDVTERVRTEQALKRSQQELRALAAASNSVREQEKSRIARELHDELGQALTALKMDVQWLRERIGPEEGLAAKLEGMQGLLDTTVTATRRISSDLRPLMLDDLGLMPAVDWLVQNFRQRTGISVDLSAPDIEIEEPYATAVFRILQESLTNVARHSRATLVGIVLDREAGGVRLSVRDNGVGFRKDAPRRPDAYGLMGLTERAFLLGGTVDIQSERDRGTSVEVLIPLPEAVKGTA